MKILFTQKSSGSTTFIYRHKDTPIYTHHIDTLSQIIGPEKQPIQEYTDSILGHVSFVSIETQASSESDWTNMGIELSQYIKKLKYKSTAVNLNKSSAKACAFFAFGLCQGSFEFNKYKTDSNKTQHTIEIVCDNPKAAQELFIPLENISQGQDFTKSLVEEPSNVLTPQEFAKRVKESLSKYDCKVSIFDESQMASMGMHALLGVGKGSANPSFFVTMEWHGGKKGDSPVCFAGKGVTFDTGGISLKPPLNMQKMKYDMAGAATVVGLMLACCLNKIPLNIFAGIGLVENMPGSNAQNPGDVVKSMSGKTIEIHNTDAEGRLVLCDVLHYMQNTYKPKSIVDLATLTGAVIVALGSSYAGLFSNNNRLAKELIEAGKSSGEELWQMPLHKTYEKDLASDIADMKNIGYDGAGSCTAAQFLSAFVNETPWAHLDIAGVAWYTKKKQPLPTGPSAFGLSMLYQWLDKQSEQDT